MASRITLDGTEDSTSVLVDETQEIDRFADGTQEIDEADEDKTKD